MDIFRLIYVYFALFCNIFVYFSKNSCEHCKCICCFCCQDVPLNEKDNEEQKDIEQNNNLKNKNIHEFHNIKTEEKKEQNDIEKINDQKNKNIHKFDNIEAEEKIEIKLDTKYGKKTFIIYKNINISYDDILKKQIAYKEKNKKKIDFDNEINLEDPSNNDKEKILINAPDPFSFMLFYKHNYYPYDGPDDGSENDKIEELLKSCYKSGTSVRYGSINITDIYYVYIHENNILIPCGSIKYTFCKYNIDNIGFFSNPYQQGKGYMSAVLNYLNKTIIKNFTLIKIYYYSGNYPTASILSKMNEQLNEKFILFVRYNYKENKNSPNSVNDYLNYHSLFNFYEYNFKFYDNAIRNLSKNENTEIISDVDALKNQKNKGFYICNKKLLELIKEENKKCFYNNKEEFYENCKNEKKYEACFVNKEILLEAIRNAQRKNNSAGFANVKYWSQLDDLSKRIISIET